MYGQPVALDGFYGGKTSFDLQPFGVANGHFDLNDILMKASRTVEEMKLKTGTSDVREQLRLEIQFWYNAFGSESMVHNVMQPHYFDFKQDMMVADF